jgi:hypothetical protein
LALDGKLCKVSVYHGLLREALKPESVLLPEFDVGGAVDDGMVGERHLAGADLEELRNVEDDGNDYEGDNVVSERRGCENVVADFPIKNTFIIFLIFTMANAKNNIIFDLRLRILIYACKPVLGVFVFF